MTLGEKLKELRGDKLQTTIAQDLKIGISSYKNYENNVRLPETDIIKRMKNYFNVSYEYLLGDSDNKTNDNVQIGKELGLSDNVITLLKDSKNYYGEYLDRFLSDINIKYDYLDFGYLLLTYYENVSLYNACQYFCDIDLLSDSLLNNNKSKDIIISLLFEKLYSFCFSFECEDFKSELKEKSERIYNNISDNISQENKVGDVLEMYYDNYEDLKNCIYDLLIQTNKETQTEEDLKKISNTINLIHLKGNSLIEKIQENINLIQFRINKAINIILEIEKINKDYFELSRIEKESQININEEKREQFIKDIIKKRINKTTSEYKKILNNS